MKIESTIQRAGGSTVALGTTVYRFLPDAAFAGAHVAEVTDPTDIQRFLSITEGYRIAVEAEAPAPVEPADEDETEADAPEQTDAPAPVQPNAAVEVTPEAPAAPVTPPAADPTPAAPIPPVPALDADAIDTMDRAALDRLFEAREGRKPSPKTKDETLREKLKELAQADKTT